LIANGETAAYIRDQMGHSSIHVTFDTYDHLFPGRGKDASERFEKSMEIARKRPKRMLAIRQQKTAVERASQKSATDFLPYI
jgi:hypothetical protein